MKNWIVRGCCAALAVVALSLPAAATAQEHGGSRSFGGSGYRGGGHYNGGHYSGHGSHGHSGSRSSFGLWIGPGWGSWGWGGSWGLGGGAWGYSDPYYRPYYRPYRYAYPYSYPDPYYSTPYRYYEPPPVVAPPPAVTSPPVYEEQIPEPRQGESVWYHCPDPAGYYPYVQQCPKGWTKVSPTPESAAPPAEEPQNPSSSDQAGPVPHEYRWYYCQDPPGYYPYVQDCPKGWTMVAPSPPTVR